MIFEIILIGKKVKRKTHFNLFQPKIKTLDDKIMEPLG
jgi:hypothetical protein